MYQIDHRCHRDGKFAKVYWTFAVGTKEEKVGLRVLEKLNSMNKLSGDNDTLTKELEEEFIKEAETI